MNNNSVTNKLAEVAQRIQELRNIYGFTDEEMAQKTGVTLEEYRAFLDGRDDMPFTFVHKCALAFGVEITELKVFPTHSDKSQFSYGINGIIGKIQHLLDTA